MSQQQLRISSWLPRSVAHGPGQRFVLWVQGCTLGCPGCFSLHTHDRRGGKSIPVEELACHILDTHGIEGITISGGEPLLQASALTLLTKMIRPRGVTVVCYTGFTLHELRSKHRADIDRFLESVDILIDGRFVRELTASLRWRGSRNQQIHFLSEVYRHLEDRSDDMSRIEFLVSQNEFTTTGVWPEDFLQQVILALSGNQE